MLVFGKKGRQAPYAIKELTQMQLSEILLKNTNKSNVTIVLKGLFLGVFLDSPNE
jgi:hypothetical protein